MFMFTKKETAGYRLHIENFVMENVNKNQLFKEILNALESKNIRLIKLLLKSGKVGCNDWIGDSGVTIIHLAAGHGSESFATTLIDALIEEGADPNVPSLDQMTPVHVAAAWGHVSVLNILLLQGGDPWLQDDEKRNAYNYAFEAKAWAVVELLHNFQLANIASKNQSSLSPTKRFYENKLNTSNILQSETVNETYFIENCSDQDCVEEVFVSTAEISPTSAKQLVIEYQDLKNVDVHDSVKKIVDSSQFSRNELKVECNRSNTMPNILSETYIVEKRKSPKSIESNLFSELLAAVKRRSDRLAIPDTELRNNLEGHLVNKILPSGISAISIRNNSISENGINNDKLPCPENLKYDADSFKKSLTVSQDSSSNEEIGNDVKLLILESNKEDIQVIDISDSVSSFLSLTDCEESSLASSLSFISCNGSPESNRFQKNSDDESDRIRSQLLAFGVNVGPITPTTKAVYVRILGRLQERGNMVHSLPTTRVSETHPISYFNSYCTELEEAIKDNNKFKQYASLEAAVRKDFDNKARTWRGGTAKTSFNYLLLDSRKTKNLPQRALEMNSSIDASREFLNAVFYIGKGQGSRPYAHLHEAFQSWQHGTYPKDPKEALILDIWRDGAGVVCLPVFHNTIPAEAFTREAAMIDALGRHHVRNLRRGEYYGDAANWSSQQKRMLGAFLLLTSKDILIRDGERVLRPCDL